VLQKLLGNIGEWLPGTADEIDAAASVQDAGAAPAAREQALDAIFERAGDLSAWKHCATAFSDVEIFRHCLVLFTIRHPASWLTGLFNNPYHALAPIPATLAEFLRFEWQTVGRERLGRSSLTPLDLYAAKLRSYASFSAELQDAGIPFRFVRFEDVVLHQEEVFRAVAVDFRQPDAAFTPVRRSTKDPDRKLTDYQDYYSNEQWRELLGGIEAEIDRRVDWELVSRFGYAPLGEF
jgi:hypothetical protein